MKIDSAITAATLRSRYHEQASSRPRDDAVTARPPLAFDDDDGDATAAWLAHVDAGPIKVR